MQTRFLIFVFMFFCNIGRSQNLVPNPDFEQYYSCPSGTSQLDSCIYWMNPACPVQNICGSPDYYHQCATVGAVSVPTNSSGSQFAHSGDAYSGIFLWSMFQEVREYIEVQLNAPLAEEQCYHFEMYVNLADVCMFTTHAIGAVFSDTIIQNINNWTSIPLTPQVSNTIGNEFDTLGWTLVSGNFIAQGGESYLIIGNFLDDASTNTIQIDSTIAATVYVYIDDVSLSPCTGLEENSVASVSVYPNPFENELNFTGAENQIIELSIFNSCMKIITHQLFSGSLKFTASEFNPGIYFYELKNNKGFIKTGKILRK